MLKKTFRDYAYVAIQFFLFLVYLYPLVPVGLSLPDTARYVGLGLAGVSLLICGAALLQLNSNLSPFPTPLARGTLITEGVYSVSRHPIYAGILGFCVGYAVYTSSGYRLIITGFLVVLFYFKSSYEEGLLQQRYPAYAEYHNRVGRFLPNLF
ncbi:methyltransferase family protein [Neolewinella antarctica]|uniref:Protein-S-isoprenylcysteine O-methyltransferase Ste14 n=1 Tax=Neolewinella antarctica TaxID=442734 RepID=A0ABX0X9W7_9BACT|nr:isoprenylcysteine carboxylmethyltransferase family protein [Neolewinella antarctica]NJC26051.1 protein-S-isoprenylcysteine O-methyltransferase Ste14 [Neolewinella antarctica]